MSSAKEKQVAQIFERTKWIIEQARQQCLLWEHHLSPKLILHGILPPPWLSHSLPKELNKDDIVSEVLFSQPHFGVPFSGRHCSLYSNLGVVSEDVQCPSGLPNEVHALRKDCGTADGLSNLPDGSVNYDGCASRGPPDLDSGAISPRNQMEPIVSDSYHDLALSLAKLQRSKSRQRALELRSAKASKRRSGDDNNAGNFAGIVTDPASSNLHADHFEKPGLVKDFHYNNQGCSLEEGRRGDCETQTNDINYSGRITRSIAQKLNSSNVAGSSVVKGDHPLNSLGEPLELVSRPLFINKSCEVEEANQGEYQRKEAGSGAYQKRTTKSTSSSQSRYNKEILKLDSTSDRRKGVAIPDFMQSFGPVELTDLSRASDQNNGGRTNIVKDSGFCNNKEGHSHGRIESLTNTSPSPVDDFLMTGGVSVNSINKSGQSPQPLASQCSQDLAVSVGSFRSQKDPDFGAIKAKEHLSRTGSGKAYATKGLNSQNHIDEVLRSPGSNFHKQSAACSESSCKKSQNVRLSEQNASRISEDAEIATDSAEKENIAVSASRNTRVVTTCAIEGSLWPAIASNVDGVSLPVKSKYNETFFDEKGLVAQENIQCDANPGDNIGDRSTAAVAKVDADMDSLVEKNPSCLGSRLTHDSPKVGIDVLASRMPSDFVMSVMPKQLDFDDVEESIMNGISNPYVKEGQQGMPSEEAPMNLSEPVNVRDDNTSLECQVKVNSSVEMCQLETEEALIRDKGSQMEYCATHFNEASIARKAINAMSPNKELPVVQKESCIPTSSLVNHSSISQVAGENSYFTHDVKHSCPQRKRRKTEIETGNFIPSSSNVLEKPIDSIEQRSGSRDLSIEEDNPEASQEDQYLTCNQEDDIERTYVSDSSTEEVQGTQECKTMEGSSLKVRKEEKLIDGRDKSAHKHLLEDKKLGSWHPQDNGGKESPQLVTCVEKSNSNRRVFLGGSAKLSDGSSVSPGIQNLDLIVTDDTVPEFEGFIMPTDNAQPCTTGDQVELEKMNLLSDSVDYTSLANRFMHSPLCYSSTRYKLHNIPGNYQSLPNGLLEGMNLRTSLPLDDGTTRSLSECLPSRKDQCTPSVQTLWDRINSNFGSSGKRQSLKLELPCISEENENMDEIADAIQKGSASSITREPLADVVDNANTSASVLQEDKLTEGGVDFVNAEINFSGTHSRIKKKLHKHDGNRRITRKGKENQSISFGTNGAKRTTASVGNRSSRPSRPKLSGKDSLKQGPALSMGKSSYNNIVSNVTSFVPLVQQKQAAAVVTGKRDIKVKALEAAEAAKRMAEKKENERKMKKEALRLERERLEQENLRQLEQLKKKKEEERKKKEAEMAAKKRQREDEEKREKDRKRKRLNDAKKQKQEQKIYNKKEEIQVEEVQESKKFMDERGNHQNLQQDIRDGNLEHISETQPLNTKDSTNDKIKESCPAYPKAVSDSANEGEAMGNSIKGAACDDIIIENSLQEQSYEISPYKGSDDEDEDEDDVPNNKFIPSWASKHHLSLAVSSQKIEPEVIFPQQSFCNIAEVLLPQKFRL